MKKALVVSYVLMSSLIIQGAEGRLFKPTKDTIRSIIHYSSELAPFSGHAVLFSQGSEERFGIVESEAIYDMFHFPDTQYTLIELPASGQAIIGPNPTGTNPILMTKASGDEYRHKMAALSSQVNSLKSHIVLRENSLKKLKSAKQNSCCKRCLNNCVIL